MISQMSPSRIFVENLSIFALCQDEEKSHRRAINFKVERFSTHQNLVTQKAVTMKSPKALEFISGALELQSTHGRAASQATGVKLTYMWHLGTAQFFDAVKVSYYGGCGKHSFEIPVFFDYSPLYLLSPENALTGIIAPFLLQICFSQLMNSWRRKKKNSTPLTHSAEILSSKKGDSTLFGDFKLISAVVNDEIDVVRPLSEILEYSKVLNCHKISSLPGFHGLDQLEGKHSLKISIITSRGRFSLKIPDGTVVDLTQFC
ncbi:unnamed protein product [Oikopleura dioica]|uniref:Uncharacterized protein n=1 Tax=Oikopleura dioica TaxID=34765 RepID=E4Y3A3_OIKDI|nr:unnamed protein product [Oikopleura dioica]